MSRLDVGYDGQKVGTLAEARGGIFFEYDAQFIATGHELSPLNLPLGSGLRSRGSSGMRLPGLFEDSLPDQWGERLMREWFRRQGIPSHSITPLMMLAYVGHRGMGALVYEPELQAAHVGQRVNLGELHEAARQVETSGTIDLDVLAEVGTSAGGARPKALIGSPRADLEGILAGAGELPPSHEAWMVKLDTSLTAADGVMEEAYALMARAAGVDMPPTRLLESTHGDNVRRHFAVKRFDRDGRQRIHHHTLAAMCHIPGCDLDYGTLLRVTRRITRDEREVWRAYRRAVFNVLASNRDDHGKNHGFLYRNREWKLGPAYDVTFRGPGQLSERGMAVCGERRSAGRKHLMALAESETLDRRTALVVIDEVVAALARWHEFASQAKVPAALAADVAFELGVQAKI
jgi:serine/threonine-protein kinase HipA